MIRTLKAFALHIPSLSIGLVFAINSILFGSWITRIPEIQNRLGLSEGKLGLALLGSSIGSLAIMPFIPWIVKRLTTGRTILVASMVYCMVAVLPVFAVNFWTLLGGLFFLGVAGGSMNVSMNSGAAAIERNYRITIMSTCHGMFSLGGMVGAGLGSLLAGIGVPPEVHLTSIALLMIGVNFLLRQNLLDLPNSKPEGANFSLPKGPLIILSLIAFCVLVCEGAIADWSAVYLRNTMGGSPFVAGLGFAGFSLMMTFGRFQGDGLVPQLGAGNILRYGSLLGAVGLLLAILTPIPILAILGFTILGIGLSCVFPILFRAAANVEGVSSETGIASVATIGTFGLLSGPPLIGFIAEHYGLSIGLGVTALMALTASLMAQRVKL